ncbi:MAG: NAD-dependent epimerase/dehydratase family protein [Candidatus Curtissbacteria bacterium]
MSKILVTGGAGFIGSHLVDRFIEEGHKVYVIDNLSTGKLANVNQKAKLINIDINDAKIGETILKIKPDYIFHLAAQTSIAKSVTSPKEDLATNLTALVPILESAVKLKVKKFVFASSAAVYGNSKKLPLSEDFPKNPISVYGISKLSAELLVGTYKRTHALPAVILRYANVYGPRQDSSQEGGVVSIFINNLLRGKPLTIFGDGDQTRDFVYVSDVVRANILAVDKNLTGIFNVSTNKKTSINDLLENIASLLKQRIEKIQKPARGLEIKNSRLSWNKIKLEADWTPTTDINQGLTETIDFFKNNS